MVAKSISSMARIIFEAYVNEACLDRALKEKFLGGELVSDVLPQYKIMPLFSLWKRHGKIFLLALLILRIILLPVLAITAFGALAMAAGAVLRRCQSTANLPELICLPNTDNLKLFHYLFDDFDQRIRFRCKNPWGVMPYLSVSDYLRASFIIWQVLLKILFYREQHGVRRCDLVFHALDVLPLTLFALFVEKGACAGKSFVTDSNLQRWDYIVIKLTGRCSVIQHAYVHSDLKFVYAFGVIDCLYVFGVEFEVVFSRYYKFSKVAAIRPRFNLQQVVAGKRVLFLASSAPYVQFEIDFLRRVKSDLVFFVVIKLHPRHVYERSVEQLVALADIVLDNACFPDCECMVSYDSFLGYEYKALGKRVLFLKDESAVDVFMETFLESNG